MSAVPRTCKRRLNEGLKALRLPTMRSDFAEVADHALALLLALTRNLHFHLLGKTDQQMKRPIELRGKRGVVIGGGGLGMLIVERAAAFGMTLDVVDPNYMQMLSIIDRQYTPDQYLEPFPDADVVFMAAPCNYFLWA